MAWADDPSDQTFVLAGLAGTGKTTILQIVQSSLPERFTVVVVTPTGKAASVLATKNVAATTIHRFCYSCRGQDDDGELVFEFGREGVDRSDLIVIVDEASMINQKIYDDLTSTKCKLLFVGDYGQLPPVGGDPGIMNHPDFRLGKIMRQAADNDIIRFAHHLREGNDPEDFEGGDDVTLGSMRDWKGASPDVWLCGTNENRVFLNGKLRTGRSTESVVILRNDYGTGLMNGQVIELTGIVRDHKGHPEYGILPNGQGVTLHDGGWLQPKTPFVDFKDRRLVADYGYALTVHKAQGSEWDHVGVLADKNWGDDLARWRYTAATRAKKHLTWITE